MFSNADLVSLGGPGPKRSFVGATFMRQVTDCALAFFFFLEAGSPIA